MSIEAESGAPKIRNLFGNGVRAPEGPSSPDGLKLSKNQRIIDELKDFTQVCAKGKGGVIYERNRKNVSGF